MNVGDWILRLVDGGNQGVDLVIKLKYMYVKHYFFLRLQSSQILLVSTVFVYSGILVYCRARWC